MNRYYTYIYNKVKPRGTAFLHITYDYMLCAVCMVLCVLSLGSCAIDTDLSTEVEGAPISFALTSDSQTRATHSGLENLVRDFRVYGVNGSLQGATWTMHNKVMDNYVVWWDDSEWNYVGSYAGGGDRQSTFNPYEKTMVAKQSIKYWDNDQPYHIFWGVASAGGKQFVPTSGEMISGFTINGMQAPEGGNTANCLYYANPAVVKKADYNKPVQLTFTCAESRIRFAFYETLTGYAVKDVKFYNLTKTADSQECLVNGRFVSSCSFTVAYNLDEDNAFASPKATPAWNNAISSDTYTFGSLQYTYPDDNKLTGTTEADKIYLGRMSTAPTYAGSADSPGYFTYINPCQENDVPMTIIADYTLVSTDGSGQEITVKGATATIPSEYCRWKNNHSYTYVFKITEQTNGQTGSGTTPEGLYPITLAAYAEDFGTENNQQGTITTFGDFSITTTQSGSLDGNGIGYSTNSEIEVSVIKVDENTSSIELSGSSSQDWVVVYHQATPYEWIVENTTPVSTAISKGAYRVDPVSYSGGTARFTPLSAGTFRIEYWHREEGKEAVKLAVKVVLVGGQEDNPDIKLDTDYTGENMPDNSFETE